MPTTARQRSEWLRLGLDLAAAALGGAMVISYLVLGPTLRAGGQSPVQMAFSVAYPVGDMIVIVGVASLLLRGVSRAMRSALWYLTAGLCLFVVGDVIYAYVTLHGLFQNGDLLDTTYVVAFALFALAAARARSDTSGSVAQTRREPRVSWPPTLGAAAGVVVLLTWGYGQGVGAFLSVVIPAAALAALVSARQLLAQRSLVVAQHQLQSAHDDLEKSYEAEKAAAAARERMEIELRLAQKLEAIGQLAAGVAHEINTPIQYIGDSTRFLKGAVDELLTLTGVYHDLLDSREPIDRDDRRRLAHEAEENSDLDYLQERVPIAFERALDGIERVSTIVTAMRAFAHPSTDRAPTDINDAIQTTLTVARNEYKYVAEIELHLGDVPLVTANAGDLNQVFLNLIVNAAHAIESRADDPPGSATIAITTRSDRRNVLVTVSDSGCGIPADIADRVFDPFFTTKPVGRGTGQGLAIAHAIIVERHHGTISFEPRPGGGTTFQVTLPLDEAPAEHDQLDQAA